MPRKTRFFAASGGISGCSKRQNALLKREINYLRQNSLPGTLVET
jgi:hypothetical protein